MGRDKRPKKGIEVKFVQTNTIMVVVSDVFEGVNSDFNVNITVKAIRYPVIMILYESYNSFQQILILVTLPQPSVLHFILLQARQGHITPIIVQKLIFI